MTIGIAPRNQFQADIYEGMSQRPRRLPCKWLYDAKGAELFVRITDLPEYYPTRTELKVMEEHGDDICAQLPTGAHLIELGSGEGIKAETLLRGSEARAYTMIDVAEDQLLSAALHIDQRMPDLTVRTLCADFTVVRHLELDPAPTRPRVIYFPGSTIGNFERDEAVALLQNMRRLAGDDGTMVIGFDRDKDPAILHAAYNDAAGVTAAFNRNIIDRMYRDLGWSISGRDFEHRAVYDWQHRRIEMRLIAQRDLKLPIPGEDGELPEGTVIVTEHSHKYDRDDIDDLAAAAGWQVQSMWSDAEEWFSVAVLSAS